MIARKPATPPSRARTTIVGVSVFINWAFLADLKNCGGKKSVRGAGVKGAGFREGGAA